MNTRSHHKDFLFTGALIRGYTSEKKAEKALERLKRRSLIVDYMRVSEIKELNERKIDFIVIITKGAHYTIAPLQIKSSWIGAVEHNIAMARIREKRIKNMFKNISVVIVNKRDSTEDLCKKILKIIS